MATQVIRWKASTSPNVVAYEVIKSDTGISGDYVRLALVLHQIPGPNWSSIDNCFYYTDDLIPYRWYRLRVLDRYGNIAEDSAPTPFQANNSPIDVPSLYFAALNENAGGQNNLQYVSRGGTPIANATIRVYKKIDWETKNYTKVVGTTLTTATGGWQVPVFVEVGETYSVVFHKPNEYGPDVAEITV